MNRVVHFEIHASEPERLLAFYQTLFGWQAHPWGPPGSYWLLNTGADTEPGIHGGLLLRRGAGPAMGGPVNAFICTVEVADLKSSMAQGIALGATEALPIMAVPSVGWVGYLIDPNGNIFGMLQNDKSAA